MTRTAKSRPSARFLSLAGIMLASLALTACSATAPDPFLTQAIEPEAPTLASDVSPQFAAAYLPSLAGGIHAVRQTVRKDYLRQEIVYANQTSSAGENLLTVEVGQPDSDAFLRPPSLNQVQRQMRTALPGMAMVMSDVIGDNVNGPYGYATASYKGGGACLYAWQHISKITPSDSSGFDKLTRVHLAANIRLRFCHPSIPADRIHLLMDGVRTKELNSKTIDLLRFAAGTAHVDAPMAVLTPEPVRKPRRKVVRQAAVTESDDWREDAAKVVPEDKSPDFIDNAAAVPLPDQTAEKVTLPIEDTAVASEPVAIENAAEVPLPE